MTTSLQSLARTIAKARHGTDAMWANYMGAAGAVVAMMRHPGQAVIEAGDDAWGSIPNAEGVWHTMLDAITKQPDSSDGVPVYLERP